MSKKILSVSEVLEEISASRNAKGKQVLNRFNKKKFEKLLKAMFNDPNFATTVAMVRKGELQSVETIRVSELFRKFCKHVVEKAGMDKSESPKVLAGDFTLDHMEGLYEFFATAVYMFMESGNRFDFIPKEDFRGSVSLKENAESKRDQEIFHPKTRANLGKIEVTKKPHKTLATKSPCPGWLKDRRKLK